LSLLARSSPYRAYTDELSNTFVISSHRLKEQRDSFAKSWADIGPRFMHGRRPVCTLVPAPEPVSAQLAKAETHRTVEETVMNAKFHSSTRSIGLHTALAAIACGVALAVPAMADPIDGEPLTKVVSYADLNINSEAGARTLYGRLCIAATEVCAPLKGGSQREKATWRACVDQAIERSVGKIDKPVLTAYHLSRTGKTKPSQVAKDR
jgi:UrcA family protein